MNPNHIFGIRLSAAAVLAVLVMSSFGTAAAATTSTSTTSIPGPTAEYASWQQQITNTPTPLSGGCFQATYPSLQWVTGGSNCTTPTSLTPFSVGNGNDWEAKISSGHIGESQGYISAMTGFSSEADSVLGTNYYSIQDNSNTWTCNTSDTGNVNADCWEQFIFANDPGSSSGLVLIQYWLIGYVSGTITACPTTHTGITSWVQSGTSCYADSSVTYTTPQENPSSLTSYQQKGYADLSGNDEAVFCHTTTCYAVAVAYTVLDLAAGWTYAEWNVLGDGGGDAACINGSGSPCSGPTGSPSLTVEQYLYNSAGTNTASSCLSGGTSGETNSLTLGSCSAIVSPAPYYMYFAMT